MIYESSEGLISLYWSRLVLLNAAAKVKPAVLNELRGLLPLFEDSVPYLERRYGERWDLWGWYITKSSRPTPAVLKLRTALLDWAKEHQLIFEWCMKSAIRSLGEWNRNPSSFKHGWFHPLYSYFVPISEDERRFILELPGWRTDYESQAVFTKRATEAFKEQLQTYTARIKILLAERDHVPVKRKNEPLVEGYDDFKLLAMKLVCRRSYKDILNEVVAAQSKAKVKKQATYNAIESRIRRTAELCMIDLALLKRTKRTKR